MDPVAYIPLPSAPPSIIISISPAPRTISGVNPVADERINYRWLGYCIFILLVFLFSLAAFCYMLYGNRKN
jgi:hypothetical protein